MPNNCFRANTRQHNEPDTSASAPPFLAFPSSAKQLVVDPACPSVGQSGALGPFCFHTPPKQPFLSTIRRNDVAP
jgi:hypothetical protein